MSVEGINCILIFENGTQNDSQIIPVGKLGEVYKGQALNLFDCLIY